MRVRYWPFLLLSIARKELGNLTSIQGYFIVPFIVGAQPLSSQIRLIYLHSCFGQTAYDKKRQHHQCRKSKKRNEKDPNQFSIGPEIYKKDKDNDDQQTADPKDEPEYAFK